jgi:CRISPR-associated protein Cmr2
MSQEYVLIFSLGPVQSFIAEARRTQDLYAGSYLLSQVAHVAARAADGELVYPAPEVLKDFQANVPNKFVTIVDNPHDAAYKARKAAEDQWRIFSNTALARLPDNNNRELKDIWERQWNHHLEFYWAAAQLSDNYVRAYERAARALDARKRTRNFLQIKEEDLKDSLSGTRSALHLENLSPRKYWEKVSQKYHSQVKEGELLDTIGAIKRFALDANNKFPSVSTVASAPFAKACYNAGLLGEFVQAIEAFNKKMNREFFYKVGDFKRNFDYDGDLFYRETYAHIRLKASYGELSEKPTEILEALEQLYKKKKAKKYQISPTPPTPYYAILLMDGDQMGKHISACQNQEEHAKLSQRLASYAHEVRTIVQNK